MKKIILLCISILFINLSFAQFVVLVNEKSIDENHRVKFTNLQNLSISFKSSVKLVNGSDGFVTMNIKVYGDRAQKLGALKFRKNKIDTINNLLQIDTTNFCVIELQESILKTGNIEDENISIAKAIKEIIKNKASVAKVELSLCFRRYLAKDAKGNILRTSEAMPLLNDFVFFIDVVD